MIGDDDVSHHKGSVDFIDCDGVKICDVGQFEVRVTLIGREPLTIKPDSILIHKSYLRHLNMNISCLREGSFAPKWLLTVTRLALIASNSMQTISQFI